ncbi:MAG: hypothetical protein Mars2KO_16050 [Maribacter sp.]
MRWYLKFVLELAVDTDIRVSTALNVTLGKSLSLNLYLELEFVVVHQLVETKKSPIFTTGLFYREHYMKMKKFT